MQIKVLKWLEDIKYSANFISNAIINKNLEDFIEDSILRAAIERHFEIIGEAINRISKIDIETAQKIGEYQKIISFRNLLIHGYDIIDIEQLWSVACCDIPILLNKIISLLDIYKQ